MYHGLTEIWKINNSGEMTLQTVYTLPPKEALIAYKQQSKHNWNTWDYPKDDPAIKETPKGEYTYFVGENTNVYTKTVKLFGR